MLNFLVLPHYKTIMPQTLAIDMIYSTPSHIMRTLGQSVLALHSRCAKRGAANTIFNDFAFGRSRPGIEPMTSHSRSGHSTD